MVVPLISSSIDAKFSRIVAVALVGIVDVELVCSSGDSGGSMAPNPSLLIFVSLKRPRSIRICFEVGLRQTGELSLTL